MRIFGVIVILLAGLLIYIRVAPVKFELKEFPSEVGDYSVAGGFTAVRKVSAAVDPSTIEAAMLALPRTQKVGDDPLTFVTRSRFFGFPDVTTVSRRDDLLAVSGHLVYGQSDLGVNRARILALLEAL